LVVMVVVLVVYWAKWPRCGTKRSLLRREYACGLGSRTVGSGNTVTLGACTEVRFRPERLIVPSNLADSFMIIDLTVDKKRQLVPNGSLPAVMFTEIGGGIKLMADVAEVGTMVSVTVVNCGDQESLFSAGVVGPAVGWVAALFIRARKRFDTARVCR
jgi:hypothetical protein